jgi:hypothetical protein
VRKFYERRVMRLFPSEPRKQVRLRIIIGGCLMLVSFFGCAPTKPIASTGTAAPVANSPERSATSMPVVPPPPANPTQGDSAQSSAAAVERPAANAGMPSVANATDSIANKSERPNSKSPVKPAAQGAIGTPAAKQPIVANVPENTPAAAPLDLASLEQRLRDTHAIGVFAKLSLKNQVDDLLDEFRSFYRGQVKIPLNTLRQRYDLLLMKVLTLLQDSDAALAAAIASSREAIWDVLKDPKKFSQI